MSIPFSTYLTNRKEGNSIRLFGKSIRNLSSIPINFSDIPSLNTRLFDVFIYGAKEGYTSKESITTLRANTSIVLSNQVLEDIKLYFFGNIETFGYLLQLVPDEVETLEDLLYFYEYTQGMLLGAILKHKPQFDGLRNKNEVSIKNLFNKFVLPELSPYFIVRAKKGAKLTKSLQTVFSNYLSNSNLRNPIYAYTNFKMDFNNLGTSNYNLVDLMNYESIVSNGFQGTPLSTNIQIQNSKTSIDLYKEISTQIREEYKYSPNGRKELKYFKFSPFWCPLKDEVTDYRLISYLDLINSSEKEFNLDMSIEGFSELNKYELDFYLKMVVLELYSKKKTISDDKTLLNHITKISMDILKANPYFYDKLIEKELLFDFISFIHYRFLLIFNSFEYYYLKRTSFEYLSYEFLSDSKNNLTYSYGNLVCLYTNEKLDSLSQYRKTRNFFNCLGLLKSTNYNSKSELCLSPDCFYTNFNDLDRHIFSSYLKNHPHIELNDFCDAFPWHHRNYLISCLYSDIQCFDSKYDDTHWVNYVSKDFQKSIEKRVKKFSKNKNTKDKAIVLTLLDEEKGVNKSKSGSLITEMSKSITDKGNKQSKMILRLLKSLNSNFDMNVDLYLIKNNVQDIDVAISELREQGIEHSREEILSRMRELGRELALPDRDDKIYSDIKKLSVKTGYITRSIEHYFPERSPDSIKMIAYDKGSIIDGKKNPLYDDIARLMWEELQEVKNENAYLRGLTPEGFYAVENSVHAQLKEELTPIVRAEIEREYKEQNTKGSLDGHISLEEHERILLLVKDAATEEIELIKKNNEISNLKKQTEQMNDLVNALLEDLVPPEKKTELLILLSKHIKS